MPDVNATPALKRRKLNDAINKPFKSPLRTTLSQKSAPHASSPLVSAPTKIAASSPGSNSSRTSTSQSLSFKRKSNSNLKDAAADPATAQEIQRTTRSIRTLESSLLKTRQDIDVLKQALNLATSNKDVELDALTTKWRQAARQAAEEVFAEARDKVNRMGGVVAWRERQAEMAEAARAWDEPAKDDFEEVYDENGELVEVEREEREERYEEVWEYDAEEEKEEKKEEWRDDDSFTMDMMLKMMNIDLEVIGYDKKRQKWIG